MNKRAVHRIPCIEFRRLRTNEAENRCKIYKNKLTHKNKQDRLLQEKIR